MKDDTLALTSGLARASAQQGSADNTVRASPAAWYALWTLCAVTLLRLVDQVVLVVGTEPMRKSLDLSDVQLGTLQGLGLQLAAALGLIPMGWLADRFDRRKVLAVAVLAWSAATVWRAYAMSFGTVMASTVGMAVADAALVPVAYALIPLLFQGRQLSQANLAYYAAGVLGFSIAMLLAGAVFKVLEVHRSAMPDFIATMESWRSASLVVGSLGPIFALMVLRMPATGRAAKMAVAETHGKPSGTTVRSYLRTHWRAVAGAYGSMALVSLGLGPLMAWLAPAVARQFGLDPATVGGEIGLLFTVSIVIGLAASGVLQRLLGARHGILVPMQTAPMLCLLTAVAFGAIGWADTRWGVYGWVGIAGVALAAYNSSMPTILQRIAPAPLRGRLTSVSFAATTAVAAAGPIIVGRISDGLHTPNGILIGIAVVGAPTTAGAALVLRWARRHVQAAVLACDAANEAGAH